MIIDKIKPYIDEFNQKFTLDKTSDDFYILNKFFMSGDAEMYFGIIKWLKPKLIIEVGGGFSSRLARIASIPETEIDIIEPHPSKMLIEYVSKNKLSMTIHKENVQDCLISEHFVGLNKDDILFIDSSHYYGPGSDVEYLIDKVLPPLNKGVYIHFHDIVWPKEYNDLYGFQNWNEQEKVKELIDKGCYKVLYCGSQMHEQSVENMKKLFPSYIEMLKVFPRARSSSLWLVKE